MELILVRHAQPVRVEPGGGAPADPGLTPTGIDQARRLAAWLAAEPVDAVLASPARRAVETARPVAGALDLEITIDAGLQEYDAHADHYIPIEDLRREGGPQWDALVQGRWYDDHDDAGDGFRRGAVETFDRIVAAHPGETVVAVCHGGVINVVLAHVLGLASPMWFEPAYASIHRVRASRNGTRSIVSVNETGHIVGRREP